MAEGMKRRDFLTVLGVTGVGVAASGCGTREPETLLSYVRPSEDAVPGIPTWYTTTCRECPAGCGIHVETHESRATKVEGNPDHPISHGNTCPRGQAAVQGLYHPDRHQGPFIRERDVDNVTRDVSWSAAQEQVAQRIREAGAGGVVMLTGGLRGSMATLADSFAAAVGGRRVEWAPLEDAPRDLVFSDADVLVSFGADFMETWGSPVDYSYQFAEMHGYRRNKARPGRFVWVGPHRPLTGLNADLWLPARPGTEVLVAQALAGAADVAQVAKDADIPVAKLQQAVTWWREGQRKVAMGPGAAVRGPNAEALRQTVAGLNRQPTVAPASDMRPVQQLIADMAANRVKVLLVAGTDPMHTLPAGMGFEQALKHVPTIVSFATFPDDTSLKATHVLPDHHFLEAWDDYVPRPGVFELVQPVMRPIFNSRQTGDVLLGIASSLGVAVAGGTFTTYFDYLRAAWAGRAPTVDAWRAALKSGGSWGSLPASAIPSANGMVTPQPGDAAIAGGRAGTPAATVPALAIAPTVASVTPAPAQATPVAVAPVATSATYRPVQWDGPAAGLHLVVYPSIRFFDGRTANRPWLLELPDQVTKVSWESWVEMHPATATERGLEQGEIVTVKSDHGSFELPLYVWPGVRRDTVAIQMGLGHAEFGRFTRQRGQNPMRLLGGQIDSGTGAFVPASRVQVTSAGRDLKRWEGLFEQGVRVQHDRAVAQAVSWEAQKQLDSRGGGFIPGAEEEVEELRSNGGFGPVPRTTDPASYPPSGTEYGQYIEGETRWGMVVDLDRCIGCAACTIACYAENNVPVVGPKEIKRGRDLSWLRIERYFGTGREADEAYRDEATDDTRFLPMLCQHCGNAPCEPVCPVYAAYHTPDGLNGQVYNRCVGTRYCANNCPWKVRVFNWFTYEFAAPLHLQLNPDVTVREKGVMEKCSFCVQRIHEKERAAAQENRHVRDGEVVPACVQACPTEVFAFGNMQDPNSTVSKIASTNRGYRSLGELNTKPAIVYLKKVTLHNPSNGSMHEEKPAPFGGDEHTPQGGEAVTPHGGGH